MIVDSLKHHVGFPGDSVVNNLPAMQETWVWSLDREDALEKEMALTLEFSRKRGRIALYNWSSSDCPDLFSVAGLCQVSAQ